MKPDYYTPEEWELGAWLSAALEEEDGCIEFLEAVRAWFKMLEERKPK